MALSMPTRAARAVRRRAGTLVTLTLLAGLAPATARAQKDGTDVLDPNSTFRVRIELGGPPRPDHRCAGTETTVSDVYARTATYEGWIGPSKSWVALESMPDGVVSGFLNSRAQIWGCGSAQEGTDRTCTWGAQASGATTDLTAAWAELRSESPEDGVRLWIRPNPRKPPQMTLSAGNCPSSQWEGIWRREVAPGEGGTIADLSDPMRLVAGKTYTIVDSPGGDPVGRLVVLEARRDVAAPAKAARRPD